MREAERGDLTAVRRTLEEAFGRPDEADLVSRLRADGDAVLSVVALEEERLVGCAVFSRMTAPFRALALAPVAVSPDRQGRGVGTRLIREGLGRAAAGGWEGVFVLGDPAYYRRFRFNAGAATGFRSPYAGPGFMVLSLCGALPVTAGEVAHAPAFASLG